MYTMSCPARSNIKNNKGIAAQADFTMACGLPYIAHDGKAFDSASDVEYMGYHISVKAYHFTLMSGTMCEGKTTLDEIWSVYARRTHSNRFAYVVNETAYIMTLNEFERFVKLFCEVEKESSNSDRQGTGSVKVRAKRCENKMVKWFENNLTK